MNKEIKFRAIIPEKNATIYFTLQDLTSDKFSNREILWPWLNAGNKPDEFTGLQDMNEKDIYERDIIEDFRSNPAIPSGKYEMIWNDCRYELRNIKTSEINNPVTVGFYVKNEHQKMNRWQIIGNIYENPELLNA